MREVVKGPKRSGGKHGAGLPGEVGGGYGGVVSGRVSFENPGLPIVGTDAQVAIGKEQDWDDWPWLGHGQQSTSAGVGARKLFCIGVRPLARWAFCPDGAPKPGSIWEGLRRSCRTDPYRSLVVSVRDHRFGQLRI